MLEWLEAVRKPDPKGKPDTLLDQCGKAFAQVTEKLAGGIRSLEASDQAIS